MLTVPGPCPSFLPSQKVEANGIVAPHAGFGHVAVLAQGGRAAGRPTSRDLDQGLVDEHGDGVEVAGVGFETKSLGLEVGRRVVDELREQYRPARGEGRRAHQRCKVDGWPWRIDFSRADSALMASRGTATSMSFFL